MQLRIVSLAILVGCGGEDGDSAVGPSDSLAYRADWGGVVAFVDDHCSGCHAEGQSASFLPWPEALEADIRDEKFVYVTPGPRRANAAGRPERPP